ncbi:MAG: formamidopyrimidine-DNA glycosylase [Betaproteobacteria bacterium]|nr:MAG: formamidopyrimidine-DNA glycosylase [Betaproteobacteria bacterium]TMH17928.1 MAG: formamidopyrimidine-DNA glycosylase [Betaproteobacteria bacterium]
MPELPDIVVYVESLERRIVGRTLEQVRLNSPFVLRTAVPPLADVVGKRILAVRRIGKRIVLVVEGGLFVVLHLMIAGRLRWIEAGGKPPATALATFHFANGTLAFTEAGTRKRASLHIVRGDDAVAAFDMGGLEVLDAGPDAFRKRLLLENHTLKRALTDPRLFSGIGNAYSDEILHRAGLSPIAQTHKLDPGDVLRLYASARSVLTEWTRRLREEAGSEFPTKVTAFRPQMAVHGRFGQPCPDCGAPVQRIVYAENETNYCARCQTGGTILADRALSRLLKSSWPRSIDELG